jgi:hypothetical protein
VSQRELDEATALGNRHYKLANEYKAELDALRSARHDEDALVDGIEGLDVEEEGSDDSDDS